MLKEHKKGGYRIVVSGAASNRKKKQQQQLTAQQQQQQQIITPTEAPNTLRSRADAIMLALVGEGEIEGSASGDILKDIYLDETAIKASNGSLNFENVIVEYRSGTQDQSYIPGISSNIESDKTVGLEIKNANGALTRTITNPNVNAVRIRLMVSSLLAQDDKGNVNGSEVEFKIEVSTQGGSFQELVRDKIAGKTTSSYERSYRIPLLTTGQWDVRITKITADSTKTSLQNNLYWQSYTEIIDTKFRYPNSALIGIRISAEQFQTMPKLSFHCKGIKILVPHNYNPVTRTYSGNFTGSLVLAYSNNPAWVFYDLITNSRYGCGKYIDSSQVDVFSLYSIGQYCDELVPNGLGGTEPRFTCNCYLQTRDDAFKVLEALSSSFRGMVYASANTIIATQDKPKVPVTAYTRANVVVEYDEEGNLTSPPFVYSGSALETRFTVALVSWSDPADFYRTKIEAVEDKEAIARYGYNPTEIVAFGCTSRSQARRFGKWNLLSQQKLTQTVTFKIGAEGLLISPGEVFKVSDPLKGGSRQGGRIKSATINNVVLDSEVFIESNKSYALTIVKSDGKIETKTVVNTVGAYSNLTVAPDFSDIPRHIWILESNAVQAQLFQCVSVAELDSHLYEINGIEYNNSIYDTVDLDEPFEELPIGGLPDPNLAPLPPSGITAEETLYDGGSAGVRIKINITWQASPSPFIREYQAWYKRQQDTEFTLIETTTNLSSEILDAQRGVYDFRIRATNNYGKFSDYIITKKEIYGLSFPPDDVTGFFANPSGNFILLSWNTSPNLDVRVGGYYKIKYTPKLQNYTWADGFEVSRVSGASSSALVPALNGVYMIKAVDSEGNQSRNQSFVSVTASEVFSYNVVEEIREDPLFTGAKISASVIGNILRLSSKDYFDSQPGLFDNMFGFFDAVTGYFDNTEGLFDSFIGNFDDAGNEFGVASFGTYDFKDVIDLGDRYSVRIIPVLSAYNVNENKRFDKTKGFFDSATGLFDGEDIDTGTVTLQIALSQNGTSFTEYQNFIAGEYTARAFKFRLVLQAGNEKYNIYVDKLGVTLDMPDRVAAGEFVSLTSGFQTVNFDQPFINVPKLAITIQEGQAGDYVEVVNVLDSSFTINVYNFSNNRVQRRVTYLAKGYGRRKF